MLFFSISIIILYDKLLISFANPNTTNYIILDEIIEGQGDNNYTLQITTQDIYTMKLEHKGTGQILLWIPKENNNFTQIYPIQWSTYATILENKYELEQQGQDFIIQILSDSQYTLIVLKEKVQFLKPNATILGMLLAQETQKYQISVQKDEYLLIEMNNCIGSAQIISKYTKITKFISDDTLMIEVKAAHPHLFKNQENGVIFNLVAHTFHQPQFFEQRNRYQYVIGYSNIYFEVEPLQYKGNPGTLTYIVHATNDMTSLQALAQCSMNDDQYFQYQEQSNDYYHDTSSFVIDSKENQHNKLITLQLQNPNLQTIYVTIVCQIQEINENNQVPLQILYETKIIFLQDDPLFLEEHRNEIIIAVSIFLFVFFLLIITVYFYKKRKQSQANQEVKQSEENDQVIQKNNV